jgi:hypothetical protein
MALAIRAKRKGRQAIENKQFCEMAHFPSLMISTAYARLTKPLVSLGERNPFAFAGFPPRRGPKRKRAKSTADSGLAQRTLRDSATPNWRRKPLESLKADSRMTPPVPVAGRENRSGELRISRRAGLSTDKNYQLLSFGP